LPIWLTAAADLADHHELELGSGGS
jgi:hypothetical protein